MRDGTAFLNLEERAFVKLDGHDSIVGEWHVNNHILIANENDPTGLLTRIASGGAAGVGTRHGYVLQRADGSTQWIVLVVAETADGGSIEQLKLAEGFNISPRDVKGKISVEAIASSREELDAK